MVMPRRLYGVRWWPVGPPLFRYPNEIQTIPESPLGLLGPLSAKGFAVLSATLDCPVAAAVFGAAAFWLIGHGAWAPSPKILRVPYRPPGPFLPDPTPPISTVELKGRGRRRGSQGRVSHLVL
jgi:hypothetical protein